MAISAMGYVGISASDLTAWQAYFERVVGGESELSDDDLRVRTDSRAWRVWVERGRSEDLSFIGWEAESEASFDDTVEKVRGLGVDAVVDGELAKRRGVISLARFVDPAGIPCELYWGATDRQDVPPTLSCGVAGYVTGNQGVGHLALNVPDPETYLRFYQALGFDVSDYIDMPFGPEKLPLTFLHCNPRHHTLAFGKAPFPKKVIHFMLQVQNLDDVGFALDRARKHDVPITISLGRHSNDHMVSFYMQTPSGFELEYGWGARTVQPGWLPVRHDTTSMWGHEMLIIPGLEHRP